MTAFAVFLKNLGSFQIREILPTKGAFCNNFFYQIWFYQYDQ